MCSALPLFGPHPKCWCRTNHFEASRLAFSGNKIECMCYSKYC
jgi:hypothetical protein